MTDESGTEKKTCTIRRLLVWGGGVLFFLVGLYVALLSLRKPWITPGPPVRLEPRRPELRAEDVKPGSAFDLLCRAGKLNGVDVTPLAGWLALASGDHADAELPKIPADVLKILDDCAPAVELAYKAAAVPDARVPTLQTMDDTIAYLSPTRNLVRVLAVSAIRHAQNGDLARTCDDLAVGMRVGQIVSRGGVVVNGLVDIACTTICCRALWRIAVSQELSPGPARKMIGVLTDVEMGREPLSEALRYEWVLVRDCIDKLANGDHTVAEYLGVEMPAVSVVGPLVGSSVSTMRGNLQHCYAHLIDLTDSDYSAGAFDARFSELSGVQSYTYQDPFGRMLASVFVPSEDSLQVRHITCVVILRAMRLYLAVRLFEQKHGAPPAVVSDLIPDFVDAMPLDPFDQKPMRYIVLTEPGVWCVYSVGENLIDDNGTATLWCSDSRSSDLVVPSRLYPGKLGDRKQLAFETMFSADIQAGDGSK